MCAREVRQRMMLVGEGDEEAEAVLEVVMVGSSEEPILVDIAKAGQQPR